MSNVQRRLCDDEVVLRRIGYLRSQHRNNIEVVFIELFGDLRVPHV